MTLGYQSPYRLAVVKCLGYQVRFGCTEVAGLVDGGSAIRAKAYCTQLVKAGVLATCVVGQRTQFEAGPAAAEWVKNPPKTRPGGNSRRYQASKETRESLAAKRFQGLRAGGSPELLTSDEGQDGSGCVPRYHSYRDGLPEMPDPAADDEFLSLEAVAEKLSVSTSTVKREIRRGKLRAYKVRGQVRVRGGDYRTYIEALPKVG